MQKVRGWEKHGIGCCCGGRVEERKEGALDGVFEVGVWERCSIGYDSCGREGDERGGGEGGQE